MKHFGFKLTAAILLIIAFFALLGWAGDYDLTEQIILHMSQEDYDSVKLQLTEVKGHQPSDRDIAHWWAEHHQDN